MPGRIIKSSLPDLYDLTIKKAYVQGYGEPTHEFEQIYNVETIDGEYQKNSYVSGFGLWSAKGLGQNVAYDGIYQGYDTTITPATYALAYTVEQESWEDDRQGILGGQLAAALAQAGRETLEVMAAAPFNAPTATTCFSPWSTMGDALALLTTSHLLPAGGTYGNTPSTQTDLSVASLQAAIIRMRKTLNARGQLFAMQPQTLIYPTDSRFLVKEILQSDRLPYTGDNTLNSVKGVLNPVEWTRLTDTDSWFLLADKSGGPGMRGHQLTCLMRIQPEFDRDNVFDSGDRRYKGRMRVGFGAWDWRGVDGSTGG